MLWGFIGINVNQCRIKIKDEATGRSYLIVIGSDPQVWSRERQFHQNLNYLQLTAAQLIYMWYKTNIVTSDFAALLNELYMLFLFFLTRTSQHCDKTLCIDESFIINVHIIIGIVNFLRRKFVTICH
ncbi:hypothetical protein ANTRET_LOCUS2324, partial [Anthophora retusa]